MMKRCDARTGRGGRAGFTMMELMMVVLIIAVLAGLVLSVAGVAARRSDRAKAIADMEKMKNALEDWRVDNGRYPDTLAMGKIATPSDPWGRAYIYVHDPNTAKFTYSLLSLGPDGQSNTADDVSMDKGAM